MQRLKYSLASSMVSKKRDVLLVSLVWLLTTFSSLSLFFSPHLTVHHLTFSFSSSALISRFTTLRSLSLSPSAIISAVLIVVTWSAANSDLYAASRALFSLALERKAPAIFRRCLSNGTPIFAVGLTALYGPLAYMGIGAVGAAQAFEYLYNLSAISIIIIWILILGTYLRFYYGLKVQNIDRRSFPYRAPFQPYGSWIAFIFLILVLIFSDFTVFMNGQWDTASFVTNYLTVPLVIVIWAVFKFVKKTKTPSLRDLDFTTGLRKLDEEDEETQTDPPTTWYGKFWDWLM